MQGRTVKNFVEQIKASIFLGAVLAIEAIKKPQSNLEENHSLSILNTIFLQEQIHVVKQTLSDTDVCLILETKLDDSFPD